VSRGRSRGRLASSMPRSLGWRPVTPPFGVLWRTPLWPGPQLAPASGAPPSHGLGLRGPPTAQPCKVVVRATCRCLSRAPEFKCVVGTFRSSLSNLFWPRLRCDARWLHFAFAFFIEHLRILFLFNNFHPMCARCAVMLSRVWW
jgi:hypothetical protein